MRGVDVTLCVNVFTTIGLGFPKQIVNIRSLTAEDFLMVNSITPPQNPLIHGWKLTRFWP